MGLLDRLFHLRESGTSAGREAAAGAVTFAALSYILFVQPTVLGAAGMDAGGVLFATCVASAVACFLMGLLANHPFALAPAMGHNFFFTYAVCLGMGFGWQQALAANLVAGVVFLALSATPFRERVMAAVPRHLGAGIAAGIGLLIALAGLEWGGLVRAHPTTYVQLGELGSPVCLLSLFGLCASSVLLVRRVPAALLFGLLLTAAVGLAASSLFALETPLVVWKGLVGAPPSPAGTAFQLDFAGLLARPWTDWLAVIVVFLFLDLFDTIGSLLGLGRQAGVLRDGRLPRARGAFTADAAGTTLGALLGTSTVTTYVESAAGISAGGRTGLTAVVTGLLMLGALVFAPLLATVGGGVPSAADPAIVHYPVIAPVLVLIGTFMVGAVHDVDWKDPVVAIPAFLTVIVMPLSFSITDGIAWGFIATSVLGLASGRGSETPPLLHLFAALFVLRYVLLAG